MFCTKCGAQMQDDAKFCISCGASMEEIVTGEYKEKPSTGFKLGMSQEETPKNTAETNNAYNHNANSGMNGYGAMNNEPEVSYGYNANNYASSNLFNVQENLSTITSAPVNYHNMGWYKFLIYFYLILAIAGSIIIGFVFMTGQVYNIIAGAVGVSGVGDLMYAIYPELKTLDFFYGIVMIGVGVFAFYVRKCLVDYKANAGLMINVYILVSIIIGYIYVGIATGVLDAAAEDLRTSNSALSLILNIIMIVCNYIYFKKREDVFCN